MGTAGPLESVALPIYARLDFENSLIYQSEFHIVINRLALSRTRRGDLRAS